MGWQDQDNLPIILVSLMGAYSRDEKFNAENAVLKHIENIDLIPSIIELSAIDASLISAMNREQTMSMCLKDLRNKYDYILIDCIPSLGMVTVNALASADRVIVPVQAQYLLAKE